MHFATVRFVAIVMLAVVTHLPSTAAAQTWKSAARAVSLTEENDAFRDSDSAYTQGLRVMSTRGWLPDERTQPRRYRTSSTFRSAAAFLSPLAFFHSQRTQFDKIRIGCRGFDESGCGTTFVGVSQTQYTPADLGTDTLIPRDRPYAGLLALNVGHTLLLPRQSFRAQLDLGVSGSPSLSRETQTLAHWTWSPGAERPRGWHHQLRASPHAQLTTLFSHAMLSTCGDSEWFCNGWAADQSFRTETSVGTVMGRVSQGAVVRLGLNMPRLEGSDRIAVTASQPVTGRSPGFWFTVYGTADARAVGWNTLIEGTPWRDGGAQGWQARNEVGVRNVLGEWSAGAAAGGRWGGVSFQWVSRSSEYRPYGGRHDYASLTLFLTRAQMASGGN